MDRSYLSNSFGLTLPYYENIISKKSELTPDEIKNTICKKCVKWDRKHDQEMLGKMHTTHSSKMEATEKV